MSEVGIITVKRTERQKEAFRYLFDRTTKYILYGGGAGGGKSYLTSMWLIGMAYRYPGTRYFVGREELKRLRESTVVTMWKVLFDWGIPRGEYKFNGTTNEFVFANGSVISMLDLRLNPSDPMFERYGSTEYTGGAIEEAGEVEFKAFDVLKTRVGRCKNTEYGIPSKILITANPKKNWLYQLFYLPFRSGTLPPEFAFVPALVTDNKYIDKTYIDNLNSITDKVTKDRLRDGIWEYDDNQSQLVKHDRILDLFKNTHVKDGIKCITADIARFGKDRSVIGVWSGYRLIDIRVIDSSSIPDCANLITGMARANRIPMSMVLVDEDGIGGGVVDLLRCKGFIANSRPVEVKGKERNFDNLKSQVSYMFADSANAADVWLDCVPGQWHRTIIEEVEQIRSDKVDDDRKVTIIPKTKVKDAIGRSPDFSDMIVMRWWFDLPHTAQITRWSIN